MSSHKIPILSAIFVVVLLIMQSVVIVSLDMKNLENSDLMLLVNRMKDIKTEPKTLFSNPNFTYALHDKNLNQIKSTLKVNPPNLDFKITHARGFTFYRDMFFYEDEPYYLILAEEFDYGRIILISILLFIITLIAIYVIFVVAFKSINSCFAERKMMMNTFFNDAMHELKTPLGVATINLEMLEIKNKHTHRIKAALKQMKITYEDVEYFIKNEKIVMSKEIINFSDFVAGRVKFITTIANTKLIEIKSQIEPDLAVFMSVMEATRLVDNNISNAIKYSESNTKILVSAKKDGEFVVFSVKDEGRGIKDTAAIWNRYSREDLSSGGFGLGLNIVLNICLKNQISYDVKSEYGKGSEFIYKIPIYKEKLLDNV